MTRISAANRFHTVATKSLVASQQLRISRRLGSFRLTYPHAGLSTSTMGPTANMIKSNRLKQLFIDGSRPAMGVWQMLPGANVSRILAGSGADWVMVDCEHGNIDDAAMHDAVPAIAALGVSPIVRLPDLQPWMIKRALDSGAHGILVPLIRTVEEVKSVVAAAKFPPQGVRGFGSPIAVQNFQPKPTLSEYLQQANESLLTMVQIETKEALEAVEDIAPLVDVVFVGPFDLGNNIGHPIINGKRDVELDEAIARVLKATVAAGKKCGIYCTSGEEAKLYADMGFHMVSAATDYTILQASLASTLSIARGAGAGDKVASY
ncbi:Pyruvate/Phosphoenolpyruvate kinase-like domain-containing protein [Podospora australis]|uniref:Pyruvate/Phosphoenolpyruvate kinase-like domain-containing protein n=1 Tax=Podospora australis TaxID=1536484 RepID=A0AAN6WY20_9PEZI|nr:Pyruvate/Phosphoenolpyruvate kinase-like domain-containing protein [Podospora australis]